MKACLFLSTEDALRLDSLMLEHQKLVSLKKNDVVRAATTGPLSVPTGTDPLFHALAWPTMFGLKAVGTATSTTR